MVIRVLALALVVLGCQEILPLADDGADGGPSSTDGFIGGDPGLQAPIPEPKPGCPRDALQVSASVDASFPFTRRAPVPIEYDAPGAARIEFRSPLAGVVEADRAQPSGVAQFDFSTGTDPIFTDTYPFTVLAFDAAGCSASARVDLPIDGDLLIGTRRGAVWFVGNNGAPLRPIALPIEEPSPISALAVRRNPLRVIIGFDHHDGPLPGTAVIELEPGSGDVTEFHAQDIQGADLYPSGSAPKTFALGPTGELWADGVDDAQVHVFHPDGRHARTVQLTDDGGARDSVLGFFADGQLIAGTDGDRELYTVGADDAVRTIVQFESAFTRVRDVARGWPAPSGEPTALSLLWIGNEEFVERHTVLGQAVDRLRVSNLSVQVVTSGDALLTRSSAGGIQAHAIDGSGSANLLNTREFTDAIGEDFINLGAMIKLERED